MKKVLNPILLLVISLFFSFCASMELERGLCSDVKQWYEKHSILMNGKVPAWIDESRPSECQHFLQLPEKMQRKYIDLFWSMRYEGAKECFYSRIENANRMFRGEGIPGWLTERGKVYVLCGQPLSVQWYRDGQADLLQNSVENEGDVCVWYYFIPGIGKAFYTFKYTFNHYWELELQPDELIPFEPQIKKIFSPTEDGWDLWAGELLAYVKEKESKKRGNLE